MHIADLTYIELGIHEELIAYVADQQSYYQQEAVHVAICDGRAAQALSSVAQEIGVPTVPDAADIYRTEPARSPRRSRRRTPSPPVMRTELDSRRAVTIAPRPSLFMRTRNRRSAATPGSKSESRWVTGLVDRCVSR